MPTPRQGVQCANAWHGSERRWQPRLGTEDDASFKEAARTGARSIILSSGHQIHSLSFRANAILSCEFFEVGGKREGAGPTETCDHSRKGVCSLGWGALAIHLRACEPSGTITILGRFRRRPGRKANSLKTVCTLSMGGRDVPDDRANVVCKCPDAGVWRSVPQFAQKGVHHQHKKQW